MDAWVQDVIFEALKALLLISVPVVAALAIVGTLLAALQSATAIQEPALSFGLKLLALAVVLYFLFPLAAQSLLTLCGMVYR